MQFNELKVLLEQKSTTAINQLLKFKFSNLLDVEDIKKRVVKEFCLKNGYKLCVLKEDIIEAVMSSKSDEITNYFESKGFTVVKEEKSKVITEEKSKVITEEMNPDYKSEMAKWDVNDPRRRLGPALESEFAKAAVINDTLNFEEPDQNDQRFPWFKKIPLNHYDLACPYCNAVMREKEYSFKYDGENKCWTHNCKPDANILMPPR
jgi:hypothetical protein